MSFFTNSEKNGKICEFFRILKRLATNSQSEIINIVSDAVGDAVDCATCSSSEAHVRDWTRPSVVM